MKEKLLIAAAAIIIGFLMYGAWNLVRAMNYNLSYKDMVQETVCEMVKPEHLKKPCPVD
jgi:hypothetical protein